MARPRCCQAGEYEAKLLRRCSAPVGISITEARSGRSLAFSERVEAIVGHKSLGDDVVRYGRYGALHADGRPYSIDTPAF